MPRLSYTRYSANKLKLKYTSYILSTLHLGLLCFIFYIYFLYKFLFIIFISTSCAIIEDVLNILTVFGDPSGTDKGNK